jgi:hypothetical protein
MNILHNSNLAKVMSFTMGGDAVGQARGQTAQEAVGRPNIWPVSLQLSRFMGKLCGDIG